MTRCGATNAFLRAAALLVAAWVVRGTIAESLWIRSFQEEGRSYQGPPMLACIVQWSVLFGVAVLVFGLADRIARWRGDDDQQATTAHALRLIRFATGIWCLARGLGSLGYWIAEPAGSADEPGGAYFVLVGTRHEWRRWASMGLHLGLGAALILGAAGVRAVGRGLRAAGYSSGILLRRPPA